MIPQYELTKCSLYICLKIFYTRTTKNKEVHLHKIKKIQNFELKEFELGGFYCSAINFC